MDMSWYGLDRKRVFAEKRLEWAEKRREAVALWHQGYEVKEIAEKVGSCEATVLYRLSTGGVGAESRFARKMERAGLQGNGAERACVWCRTPLVNPHPSQEYCHRGCAEAERQAKKGHSSKGTLCCPRCGSKEVAPHYVSRHNRKLRQYRKSTMVSCNACEYRWQSSHPDLFADWRRIEVSP